MCWMRHLCKRAEMCIRQGQWMHDASYHFERGCSLSFSFGAPLTQPAEIPKHPIAASRVLTSTRHTNRAKKKEKLDEVDLAQMSLFDTVKDDDILEELKNVDLSNMTPIDALNKLYELQNKIKNRW